MTAPYEHRVHRVATMLHSCGEVVYTEWPHIEAEDTLRKMSRVLSWLLNDLVNGDVPRAEQHHHELAELRATVPNGDTTPGAI